MTGTNASDDGQTPGGDPPPSSGFFARRRNLQSPSEALQPEAAPPPPGTPPSRRRPALSALSGLLSFLLVAAVAGIVGLGLAQHRLTAPGPLASDRVVVIAAHTDVPDIVSQLEREGVIDSPLLFNVALLFEGNRSRIKHGEYLFRQNASLQDVLDTLVSGKQVLHAITIPEGLTSEQVVERLRADDVLAGDVREIPKEGTLLPETYKFERGFSRTALLHKMEEAQKKVLAQVWAHRAADLPLRTPADLVTLASIVEKETGKVDERPRVARVFLNRLQKHMRLQSDPTIVYGLVGGRGTLGRGITRSELMQPTPYNTYLIDGLPPGPIANPGRAALEAVANPSRTNELYFVADGTGGHIFSDTLEQHNRNVQRWRQIEKERAASAPAGDVDHVTPQDIPANGLQGLRGEKHSALEPANEFGLLPQKIVTARSDALAQLQQIGAAAGSFAPYGRSLPVLGYADDPVNKGRHHGRKRKEPQAEPLTALNFGPSLDQLGLTLQTPAPRGSALLDGPVDKSADEPQAPAGAAPQNVASNAVPVSPAMMAEIKAKAARYGLDAPSSSLPDQTAAAAGSVQTARSVASNTPSLPMINGRVRVIDASEGTPLDPLKNKSWDLNSPQKIPPGVE